MTESVLTARFLEGANGRLFTLMRRPTAAVGGACVLVVPAFGEEMNKARRMIAEVSRGLAARGIASLQPDLFGTGDSEGEFSAATWATWRDDLGRAAAEAAREGWTVKALLCVRLGCVLGAQLAKDALPDIRCTVFWQPVTDGERFLTQFLRLRVAATMMDAAKRETIGDLKSRLQRGELVEVAGYELNARLANEIEGLRLAPVLGPHLGELHWMEIVRDAEAALAGSSTQAIEAAQVQATIHRIVGEPFWSATEIVQSAELLERTGGAFACLQ